MTSYACIPMYAIMAMILQAGCRNPPATEQTAPAEHDPSEEMIAVNADTSTIAVFTFDTSYYWIFEDYAECRNAEVSLSELGKVETLLQQCVEEYTDARSTPIVGKVHNAEEDPYRISRKGYLLQCIAVINSQGEKEVWVNALCDHHWPTVNAWREIIQMVSDGGGCYYQLKVNLTKGTYYDLSVNGIA